MRQSGENDVRAVEIAREAFERSVRIVGGKLRVGGGNRITGAAAAEQAPGAQLRVPGEEPEQFRADIAGRAKDRRTKHGAGRMHTYA